MTFTKNLSYVHQAGKKRTEEQDFELKMHIEKLLRDFFGIYAFIDYVYVRNKLTNEYFFYEKEQVNFSNPKLYEQYQPNTPDLYSKYPERVYEFDGLYHVFTKRGIEQTKGRNENYAKNDFTEENHNLIILDSDEIEYDDEKLVSCLSAKLGMQPCKPLNI